jgi:hypothetical protein
MKLIFRLLLFCLGANLLLIGANASIALLPHPQIDGAIRYLHAIQIVRNTFSHRVFVLSSATTDDIDEDDTPTPAKAKHSHSSNENSVKIGSNFKLGKNESSNQDVVIIGGTGEIDGTVNGDLVMIGSKGRLSGTVNGDVVLIGTTLDIKPGAIANGDFVSIGADAPNSDRLKVNGDRTDLGAFSPAGPLLTDWISNILLLRPMSPFSVFGWTLAIIALLVRVAVGAAFPKPFAETDRILRQRLAPSFVIGLGVIIGTAILCSLLTVTVVGILAIPFVILGALILGFLGRISVSYSIGKLLLPRLAEHRYCEVAWITAGTVVTWILFCIPIVGCIAYGIAALLSFGVFSLFLVERYRLGAPKQLTSGQVASETQPSTKNPPTLALGTVETSGSPDLQKAPFLLRLGSNLIDLVVLYVLLYSVHQTDKLIPIWVIYRFAMYTWRSATLGEISLGLHVQKPDGASLAGDYSTSLIRALSSLISLLPIGLGFIWILFDPAMESWHDKISGSFVRKKGETRIQNAVSDSQPGQR